MADIERKGSDAVDNTIETKKPDGMDDAHKKNAVGYDEYLEALDLEVSDKEVHRKQTLQRIAWLTAIQVQQSSVEARPHHSSHVSHHPSLAVHGQDLSELRQPFWVPRGIESQGTGIQLPVGQSVFVLLEAEPILTHATVIYAGYFFGQYPCGWLIGRFPAQRVMAISIFLWGVTVLILTQCRTYSSASKSDKVRDLEYG